MTKTDIPYKGAFDGTRLNAQPIQKLRKNDTGETLSVHSVFYTVQGEGPFSGQAAVFVRLAGCNLQCPMCDTEYTDGVQTRNMKEILRDIQRHAPPQWRGLVVVSGGEPFRQNLSGLLRALVSWGYYVQVESNGTLPPPTLATGYNTDTGQKRGVYIVCSPKTGKVHDDIRHRACCFKYVLSADAVSDEDGLPTSVLGLPNPPARPSMGRDGKWIQPVYVQPADHQDPEVNEANARATTRSGMRYGYTIQLQIHKYLNMK